jgi:hypothetical protein
MPAAHIAPATAMKVTAATNIAAANRQLLCMEHLNCWIGLAAGSEAPFGRLRDDCGIICAVRKTFAPGVPPLSRREKAADF